MRKPVLLVLSALCLSACAHHEPPKRGQGLQPGAETLLRYDFSHDGQITRAELEEGIRQDFNKADTNHDGRLDETEVRAVNQERWAQHAASTSPLVDWDHDGYVDLGEFAAGPRSLFDDLDSNGDGVVSKEELKPFVIRNRHKRQPGDIPGLPGGDDDGNYDPDSD
jgi:hypothetical protein